MTPRWTRPAGQRSPLLAAPLLLLLMPLTAMSRPLTPGGTNAIAADSISAPISGISYDVTFTRATAERSSIDVAMSFTVDGAGPVILSLPDWTPGNYEIDNFSRWVLGFDPTTGGTGTSELSWDKLSYDRWRIRTNGAHTVTVHFSYAADTLDNAMAWTRPDFALFNGTNLFMYAEGRPLDFSARVTIHTENEWRIATGMMPVPGASRSYSASNYHDLVDMPFFIGHFDVDSTQIASRWVRLATYPAGKLPAPTRAAAITQLTQVIPPEIAVFGEAPWPNYTVMQIVDSGYDGASGLEHQSSHVDVVSPQMIGSDFQPSLYAHEIFHSWNVKRLRPADMWPYVYSRPQPTPWLWVSEGITDYYADLAEVRGKVVNDSGFYALTASKINEVDAAPPTALGDASLSTWVHPVDGTEYIYYPKGSLAGFMLDIIIRDASDNQRSLDGVMRELYQTTYKQGRGFTAADWWGAVSRAAGGKSFDDFNARFVDGRDPYPWDSILPKAGLRAVRVPTPRLGISSQQDPSGVLVVSVAPNGSGALAGVEPGDYLLSVASIPVEDQSFGDRFRAQFASVPEGTSIPIRVRRLGQQLTLTAKLQFAPGAIQLQADPQANAKAVRIREGILKGS